MRTQTKEELEREAEAKEWARAEWLAGEVMARTITKPQYERDNDIGEEIAQVERENIKATNNQLT